MNTKFKFLVNEEEWSASQIERLEYERNLHILHQMKEHGIEIKDGDKVLSDDDIDMLTADEAWKVSIAARTVNDGVTILEHYKESFERSDEMWKKLGFSQDKPMKVSYANMYVDGMSVQEYMGIMKLMQEDEGMLISAHPEHFHTVVEGNDLVGIEPFGAYGTPTLCNVKFGSVDECGAQIRADKKDDFPVAVCGRTFLRDGVTEVNTPFHQLKPTANGFEAIMAVYWPEGVPDEIVSGHSLHLIMEFYRGLKIIEDMRDKK